VLIALLLSVLSATGQSAAQLPPPAKGTADAVQHGAQPNPDEVRPGSRDGDAPSAASGEIVHMPGHRVLGLPVNTILVIAGVLVVLMILGGLVIPGAGRRLAARGGGTYGLADLTIRPV
jgi:hypothetical protein